MTQFSDHITTQHHGEKATDDHCTLGSALFDQSAETTAVGGECEASPAGLHLGALADIESATPKGGCVSHSSDWIGMVHVC